MSFNPHAYGRQQTASTASTSRASMTTASSDDSSVTRRNRKKGMTLLPADFTPTQYSVFCGRGKGFYNATGNRRLRVTVMSFMQEYMDADGVPTERSRIICRVKDIIKECCPVGAFIKYENGRYYELSDKAAREKCSALFRDCAQAKNAPKGGGGGGAGGGQPKKGQKTKRRDRGSTQSTNELSQPSHGEGAASRQSSVESGYSSASSMGSFFDVDTKQPASIRDALQVEPTVSLNGLDEFLGRQLKK